jgi:N-hydroxyarylamine O-acetyltransferase
MLPGVSAGDRRADPPSLDLAAYLLRVGSAAEPSPSLAAVAELIERHLGAIPFENLDVRLGREIRLDLPSLEAKLVQGGRGGYCFEQNTLFAAVLRAIGLEVATLEARVRPPGATTALPRTHMTLRAEIDGASWLVDVGFGGDGPAVPVPLSGEPVEEAAGSCRVAPEGERLRVLQRQEGGGWTDLYAFTLDPALPVDFEVASHFTATHPRSVFVQTLTVQRTTPRARHILRGRLYTRSGASPARREGLTDAEVHALLTGTFSLPVSAEEVGAALAGL